MVKEFKTPNYLEYFVGKTIAGVEERGETILFFFSDGSYLKVLGFCFEDFQKEDNLIFGGDND